MLIFPEISIENKKRLIIAVSLLLLLFFVDWIFGTRVCSYQESGYSGANYKNKCNAALNGPFFTLLAILWHWAEDDHHAIISVATAGLLIVTACLAGFTWGLMKYTKLLWGATGDLVADAKESSKKELRAYVCMAELKVEDSSIHGVSNKVLCLRMRNLGNTPANHATIRATITDQEPVHDFDAAGVPHDFGLHPQSIYPGKSYQARYPISIDTLTELFTAKSTYVFGYIDYDDAFEGKWRSKFCFEWDNKAPERDWMPYKKHNEEKPRKK